MREELRKYGDEAYDIVKYAANEIGPRLPGSEGENKLHDYMASRLEEIDVKPVKEKFVFAPHASIGGLPYAGWGGIIGAVGLLLAGIFGSMSAFAGLALSFVTFVYMAGLWTWLIVSVFKYKTCFDWCFKHAVSHNTYGELLPKDGKYDYTVFVSGHTDTSWTLKLSASQGKAGFKSVVVRLAIGAVSVGIVTVLALVTFIIACVFDGVQNGDNVDAMINTARASAVMSYINLFSAPLWVVGSFFLTMYNEKTECIASPGAMDNATGIAIAYEVLKYYRENPDKMPARCRIVDVNCGAEESGLRGSLAFTRNHKDDGMLENAYHLNVDSIADKEHFEVINGDAWLCPHFDKGLEDMFVDAMKEAGIENPGKMANPVGGCDSTPFQKNGVKSITFAAQNPEMTTYYHTYMDVPERFEAETVGLGLDVVLRVIDKIAAAEEAKRNAAVETPAQPATEPKTEAVEE
ncbi:MAG: M20/M25/M40 family metallo-hydrolase [Clostridia bacterium]|nr:M20/M25/M40 family metallo-hydrolase [Clostridia bacterium]